MMIKEQLAESQGICEYPIYVQGSLVCFAYFIFVILMNRYVYMV